MLELKIDQKVVPKARPRHNGSHSYLPKSYRAWKELAIFELQIQYGFQPPIPRAAIAIKILGSARGDLDNLAGAVLDALVQASVIVDDRINCVPDLRILHVPGKKNGAIIEITPIYEGPP